MHPVVSKRRAIATITLTAIVAAIIAIAVLWITIGQVAPEIKMMMNNGTKMQGQKYIELQAIQKICSSWRAIDYIDTVDVGLAKAFNELGLTREGSDNIVCSDPIRDYVNCVKKCAAFESLMKACQDRTEGCYSVGAKYFQRCDVEGCTFSGGGGTP